MKRLALVAVAFAVALPAGCGGSDDATTAETTTGPAQTVDLRVYWLREGKVWPALREVEDTDEVAGAALDELLRGPTADEQRDLAMSTAIPAGTEVHALEIADGVATVHLSKDLNDVGLAQVVYTLTQFSSVERVDVQDETRSRADFEYMTPAILVEAPLPFEEVGSPLRATGTANTFEATFEYELTDTDGKIVDTSFVTATSGTGTRGTFDFTTKPYTVPFDGVGSLIVFERSAANGSRMNVVEIPLRMTR